MNSLMILISPYPSNNSLIIHSEDSYIESLKFTQKSKFTQDVCWVREMRFSILEFHIKFTQIHSFEKSCAPPANINSMSEFI